MGFLGGVKGTTRLSENFFTASTPRTWVGKAYKVTQQQTSLDQETLRRNAVHLPPSQAAEASQRGNPEKEHQEEVMLCEVSIEQPRDVLTSYKSAIWSRYLAWILILEEHIAQGASPGGGIKSWFTERQKRKILDFSETCSYTHQ